MTLQQSDTARREKAVVTGASAGIGRAYAQRLAARGYDLVLVARRGERLQALAAELSAQHSVAVNTVTADLSVSADLERLCRTMEADEAITMLVNCAGLGLYKPVAETPVTDLEAMIAVNVLALARLSRSVLPAFVANNTAR